MLKAYRPPREATWLTGMVLLGLTLAFGFSGYLLPWNQLAFFATKVGTDITGAVPVVGDFMMRFLRGGEHISGGTLTRFFGFHVAVLPAIATLLVGLHVYLVQRHGMSVPPGVEASGAPVKRMKFVPNFLLRDMVGWLAALGLLALLSALFPWELGLKADPYASAPAGIKPEWYFGWMFQTLRMLPSHILGLEGELVGIFGIGLGALVWVAAPFIDDPKGQGRRARIMTALGAVAIVYVVGFTLLVYRGAKP
jgi:cytochrome b6